MQPVFRNIVFGLRRSADTFFAPISNLRTSSRLTGTLPDSYAQYHTNRTVVTPESMEKRFLFVGLGNHDLPNTRHSVGMQVVDKMAQCLNVKFKRVKECVGSVARSDVDGVEFVLLKPKMPMNVNGTSVAKAARHFGVAVENIYLLHDDIEKRTGYLSVKEKGSASGHNGVKSVIHSLHTDVIPRIKIGIDRPADKDMMAEYVLARFPREEQAVINKAINESLVKITQHLKRRIGSDVGNIFHCQSESNTDQNSMPINSKLNMSDSPKQGTSLDVD